MRKEPLWFRCVGPIVVIFALTLLLFLWAAGGAFIWMVLTEGFGG